MSAQKATLGTGRCRPKAPSGLHWHAVSVWPPPFFGGWTATIWSQFLVGSESNVAAGQRHPPAFTGMLFRCGDMSLFWRSDGYNLERAFVGSESNVRHRPATIWNWFLVG